MNEDTYTQLVEEAADYLREYREFRSMSDYGTAQGISRALVVMGCDYAEVSRDIREAARKS